MNKIVWVFGNAAVGKETFIRFITSGKDPQLCKQLGLDNNHLHIIEESIAWVSYDTNKQARHRIPLTEVIIAEIRENTGHTFLIKGQFIDLEDGRMEAIYEALPEVQQHIIYLDASPEVVFERLKTKSWFKASFDIRRVQRLLRYETDLLLRRTIDVPLIVVESGDGYQYRVKKTAKHISEYLK